MNVFRKIVCFVILLGITFFIGLLAGCSSNELEARTALENYLNNIKEGDHTAAYKLVSDFDKKKITKEVFDEWRTSAERIVKIKSFSIGEKYDRFKNYEYMGTRFKDAYGFDVKCDQKIVVPGAETTDYDKDNFKIMVVKEDGGFKIALLIADMKETADKYNSMK